MKSAGKEIGDQVLHVVLAVAGLIWIALQPNSLFPYMFSGFWFGVLREDAQHRAEDGWSWPLQGEGGRWLDILASTVGGAAVGAVAMLIERGTQ